MGGYQWGEKKKQDNVTCFRYCTVLFVVRYVEKLISSLLHDRPFKFHESLLIVALQLTTNCCFERNSKTFVKRKINPPDLRYYHGRTHYIL